MRWLHVTVSFTVRPSPAASRATARLDARLLLSRPIACWRCRRSSSSADITSAASQPRPPPPPRRPRPAAKRARRGGRSSDASRAGRREWRWRRDGGRRRDRRLVHGRPRRRRRRRCRLAGVPPGDEGARLRHHPRLELARAAAAAPLAMRLSAASMSIRRVLLLAATAIGDSPARFFALTSMPFARRSSAMIEAPPARAAGGGACHRRPSGGWRRCRRPSRISTRGSLSAATADCGWFRLSMPRTSFTCDGDIGPDDGDVSGDNLRAEANSGRAHDSGPGRRRLG